MIPGLSYSLLLLVLISGPINGDDVTNSSIYWEKVGHQSIIPLWQPTPVGKEGPVILYLCRMQHNNLWRPGKYYTDPTKVAKCHATYDFKQVESSDFEMLRAPPGTLSWVPFTGQAPPTAIDAGVHLDGSTIAIVCRVYFKDTNELIPGIYGEDKKACWIGKGGREFEIADKEKIEILMANKYARYV